MDGPLSVNDFHDIGTVWLFYCLSVFLSFAYRTNIDSIINYKIEFCNEAYHTCAVITLRRSKNGCWMSHLIVNSS